MKQGLKLTPKNTVNNLRFNKFKPLFEKGKLVDWRKVEGGELITAEVTVHTSGRVTIVYRSSANGKGARRKRDRKKAREPQSTGEVNTPQA